jgi:hypothetical protein
MTLFFNLHLISIEISGSPKLLDWLFDKFRPSIDTKILLILDVDAYIYSRVSEK